MATPLTGLDGTVEIEGTVIASMRSWTMTIEMDAQDVGGFGSQWEIQKAGRKSYGGSVEGVWAYADASGQGALATAMVNNTQITLTLGVDASHEYVVEAYITNFEVNVEYDGVAGLSFEWVGAGTAGPTSLASHA